MADMGFLGRNMLTPFNRYGEDVTPAPHARYEQRKTTPCERI